MSLALDKAFFLNLRSAVDEVLEHRPPVHDRLLEALEIIQHKDFSKAQSILEPLILELHSEADDTVAYAVSLLARCYAGRSKIEEGVKLLESEDVVARFQGPLAASTLQWLLAHFYRAQGRHLEAKDQLQQALDLILTSSVQKQAFRIVSDLANVHLALGDTARAITLYETAISEFEEDTDYHDALIRSRLNLASVYQTIGRNEDALRENEYLLTLPGIDASWPTFIALKLNRAITLKALERMEESFVGYKEVRDLAHGHEDPQIEARALLGLSEHARQAGQADDALELAREAHQISLESKSGEMVALCMKRIAVLEHALGNVDVAVEILRECYEQHVANGNRREAISVASECVEFLTTAQRYQEALETLHEQVNLQKTVYQAETERAVEIATVRARLAEEKEAARVRDEERSRVLNAVMPAHIASRLTAGERQIVDTIPSVTILFADVVGFTELVSSMSGEALLELLSKLFSGLDLVASRFGCERIKTIGDSYMAICGASEQVDDHVERIARMALEIVNGEVSLPIDPSKLRIGINTGPVIAGVMDGQRISYDVWGDTVNVAARMEEHSRPGSIGCTEAVAGQLAGIPGIRLIKREPLAVQGKGLMTTYWIERA